MPPNFPLYKQYDQMDCGPTCLRMIAKHYGKNYALQELRRKSFLTREGVSLQGISEAAEAIGFRTVGAKIPFEKLIVEASLPCIVHWNQNHFVVVHKIDSKNVHVADPVGFAIAYSLKATEIAHLYKHRWKIELFFFKWIKQRLKIKSFWRQSEMAVKTQVWIAISVYVLVAIAKKKFMLKQSLYEILQVIRISAFEKVP